LEVKVEAAHSEHVDLELSCLLSNLFFLAFEGHLPLCGAFHFPWVRGMFVRELFVPVEFWVFVLHFCSNEVSNCTSEELLKLGESLRPCEQTEDVNCLAKNFVIAAQNIVELF
jgi:hypothetical protein